MATSTRNGIIYQYHIREVGNNMAFGEWKPETYLGFYLTL